MQLPKQWIKQIQREAYDHQWQWLYGGTAGGQAARHIKALRAFEDNFGVDAPACLISAPGRTELCGNHTDHQRGHVLAAAVTMDMLAAAAPRQDGRILLESRGYGRTEISLSELAPKKAEEGTTAALLRGMAARLNERGHAIGGFEAYVCSDVPAGSGLSSSAAMEVLIGSIFNFLYNNGALTPVYIAQAGQYAENRYFGKPCGLMDQASSAIGGFALLDFADPAQPRAEKIPFDFADCGCRLCIIDTKGSHSDLTPDYAAIPAEMKRVAACFGKNVLSQVDEAEFYSRIPQIRAQTGDRALLRAIHFFGENRRVGEEAEALRAGNFQTFLRLVTESGRSSFQYLQNVYSPSRVKEQGVALALALCEKFLAGRGGAWRVHGGGFAGTVQAYVPADFLGEFTRRMESVFGQNSCRPLTVRPVGGIRIL